jgi:hypothetical protein
LVKASLESDADLSIDESMFASAEEEGRGRRTPSHTMHPYLTAID